jgi:hypothetical protein
MSTRYRLTIIHCVPDFERWIAAINAVRRPSSVKWAVYRSVDDPNEVMVDDEVDSAEHGRELLSSVDLRELLDRAGVEIYPPVFIGEQVDVPEP